MCDSLGEGLKVTFCYFRNIREKPVCLHDDIQEKPDYVTERHTY